MQNKEYIAEDEIDLKELFKTIWNKRVFILVFTAVVTSLAVVYVYFKNPIPIFQGKTYVEIGQIQSQNFGEKLLDNSKDLSEILKLELNVSAIVPKGTTNLLEISFSDKDKEVIKINLEKSIEFIIKRHNMKTKYHENVIMTKQIGDIVIGYEPINKPKKLLIVIVGFVTGFIMSIFLVFIMQFINNIRKEEN